MSNSFYGEDILSLVTVDEILKRAGLSDMDIEIFILRFGLEWFFYDIGIHVGIKYKGKELSEGAIRYRCKKIRRILDQFIDENIQD
jgi:hypothetical protein